MPIPGESAIRVIEIAIQDLRRSLKDSSPSAFSREAVLGLAFRRGDKVIDRITKKGGEILAGTRITAQV